MPYMGSVICVVFNKKLMSVKMCPIWIDGLNEFIHHFNIEK